MTEHITLLLTLTTLYLTQVHGDSYGNASLTVTDTAQVSAAAGHGVVELKVEQNTTTPFNLKKMYEIRTEEVDWEAAVNKCRAGNMTLASIRSIEEQIEFNNTVSSHGGSRRIWIGATDLGREAYDLVWVGDNSRLNYTNWEEYEPAGCVIECHCVRSSQALTWHRYNQWCLVDCGTESSYACEYYN